MNNIYWNVLYAGLDLKTFFLLNQEKDFNLSAVAYIDKFNFFSINPVNYLFKLIYFLRLKNRFYFLEFILNKVWLISAPFSSGVFYKYRRYLYTISICRISVVDILDVESSVFYIKKEKIDVLIVSVWPLLSEKIISAPKYISINIHPSILPKYRGALPTLWSLKNYDKESAVTYMIINSSMDTGNIIAQHFFAITDDDNWISLENKIAIIIKDTLVLDIKSYLLGKIKPIAQNSDILFSKTETYEKYRKVNPGSEFVKDIYNKVNLYPLLDPGVYCYGLITTNKIWLKRASFSIDDKIYQFTFLKNGEFIINTITLFIKCNGGILELLLFRDVDVVSSVKLMFVRFGKFI